MTPVSAPPSQTTLPDWKSPWVSTFGAEAISASQALSTIRAAGPDSRSRGPRRSKTVSNPFGVSVAWIFARTWPSCAAQDRGSAGTMSARPGNRLISTQDEPRARRRGADSAERIECGEDPFFVAGRTITGRELPQDHLAAGTRGADQEGLRVRAAGEGLDLVEGRGGSGQPERIGEGVGVGCRHSECNSSRWRTTAQARRGGRDGNRLVATTA